MTQSDYARHRGVSRQYISKIAAQGMLVLNADGSINAPATDAKLDGTAPQSDVRPGTLQHAKLAETILKVKLKEVELKRRNAELVPLSEVNEYISGTFTVAKEVLLRMPGEMKEKLALESDPNRIESLLMSEVHRALRSLAEYRPESAMHAA